ncbi:MAG: transglutaminase-like domain-containing protein [Pirellulales bacterium]
MVGKSSARRRSSFRATVLGALLLLADSLVPAHAPSQETPRPAAPTPAAPAQDFPAQAAPAREQEVQRWIEQLDADSFSQRERATRSLQQVGTAAEEQLLEALRSPSPEVRRRAAYVLRDSHWRRLHGDIVDFAARPDERLDVEHGMWLVARILDPSVKQRDLQQQLNALADRVRAKFPADMPPRKAPPRRAMEAIRDVLFVELHFHGATQNYQDPRNSSLACVLQRKEGLPILLSNVVVAVGARLGLPLEGLATPGRYLVKYQVGATDDQPQEEIVMDAFDGGKILSSQDLTSLFPGFDSDDLLLPASPRQTLVRMLNNLETHLYHAGDGPRAELAVYFRTLLERDEDF